jgi:hypothetical protein
VESFLPTNQAGCRFTYLLAAMLHGASCNIVSTPTSPLLESLFDGGGAVELNDKGIKPLEEVLALAVLFWIYLRGSLEQKRGAELAPVVGFRNGTCRKTKYASHSGADRR